MWENWFNDTHDSVISHGPIHCILPEQVTGKLCNISALTLLTSSLRTSVCHVSGRFSLLTYVAACFLSPDTRALLATLLCWQGSLSMIKSSCLCHFGPDRAKAILKCVWINCVKNCPSIFSYTSSRTTPFPLVIATNKCNWGPPAKSLLPFAANCRPSFFFLHIRLFVPATACRGLRLWTKGTPLK